MTPEVLSVLAGITVDPTTSPLTKAVTATPVTGARQVQPVQLVRLFRQL